MNDSSRNAQVSAEGAKSAGHGEKLSRLQEQAVGALMCEGGNLRRAAETCGVHESTLRRWMAIPRFEARYRKEREHVLETTGTLLRNKAVAAVFVLDEIMQSKRSKPMARVSAARAILEFCHRSAEQEQLTEIRRMIEQIESHAGGKK